jgi:hypothetical protein
VAKKQKLKKLCEIKGSYKKKFEIINQLKLKYCEASWVNIERERKKQTLSVVKIDECKVKWSRYIIESTWSCAKSCCKKKSSPEK